MNEELNKLLKIQRLLRKKCPWDKQQTLEDYKALIKEESDELINAIENKDTENIKEELGDLLHVLLMFSIIAEENGLFDIKTSIKDIRKKLIRRHPHIFANKKAETPQEAMQLWNEEKKKEKNLIS